MILSCIFEHVKKQHRCVRHDDAHFLRVAGFSASRPRSLLVLLLSCRSPLRMASRKELDVSRIYCDFTFFIQSVTRAILCRCA